MDVTETMKVLAKIWGRERDGYVFLPWIPASAASSSNPRDRRHHWKDSRAFKWPKDRELIEKHIIEHQHDDLFFTPHRFLGRKRVVENVADEVILYSDLDDFPGRDDITTPEDIPAAIRPSVCWETSPGSYQGVWLFNGHAKWNVYEEGMENQALTYHLGGDRGGWHGSKVLRVPGSFNNKADKQSQGRILWWRGDDAKIYTWEEIEEEVPKLKRKELDEALVNQDQIDDVNRHATMARLRFKLNRQVRKWLRQADEPDIGQRSEIMYSIAQELSDAGASFFEIIAVVQASVWNKHRDEPSELVRLVSLAQKVQSETKRRIEAGELTTPDVEDEMDDGTLEPVSAMFNRRVRPPEWLVDGLWTTTGCGWVAGAPKSYKSWLSMHLAACVAAGERFMGRKIKQRSSLVIQMEDDEPTVKDRLDRVLDGSIPGAHPLGQLTYDDGQLWWEPPTRQLPLYYKIQVPFVSSDEAWQDWLDDMIGTNGLGLVLIDTMFASMGDVDLSDSMAVQTRILNPLKAMAKRHNCAVMIVHHSTKSNDNGRGAQLLGSQALRGWADCGIYFGERDENRKVPVDIENKHGNSIRFGVDVSALAKDATAPEVLAVDHEGYEYTQEYRSVWDPSECLLEGQQDDDQFRPEASTPGHKERTSEKFTPGVAIAKEVLNIGANSPEKGKTFTQLHNELLTSAGKHRKKGSLSQQLTSAIDAGLMATFDNDGKFKNPRYYSLA